MRAIVFAAVSILVVSTSVGVYALDLNDYTIDTIETDNVSRVPAFLRGRNYHLYDNVFVLHGVSGRVLLAQSATEDDADGDTHHVGFAADTLTLRWLDENRLIWASWRTAAHPGSGLYSQHGHALLLVEESKVVALFQDSIYGSGCVGVGNCTERTMTFAYSPKTMIVTMTLEHRNTSTKPLFQGQCACPECEDEHAWTTSIVEIREYQLRGAQMRFLRGETRVDLGGRCRIEDIATWNQTSPQRIRKLNKLPRACKEAHGVLVVGNKLGPYVPEQTDGLCGEKPCPPK